MKVFYREEQTAKHNSSFSPSAGKPAQAVASWKRLGLPVEIMDFEPATRDQLKKVHDAGYVDDVLDLKRSNGFNNKLPEVAAALPYVAGSMVAATLHALKTGETAFSPTSGAHHACFDHGGGFCTFNFLALAACEAYEAGAKKVGVIDCDMHYGNGTADIISRVGLHFVKHYTFGGDKLSRRESVEEWMARFPGIVRRIVQEVDVLIYNAGADPHIEDSLGGVLTTEQLKRRDEIVLGIARELNVPVAISLAGGYQDPIKKVLEIHDNTFRIACSLTEENSEAISFRTADNYEDEQYKNGYHDALSKVLAIIRECNEQAGIFFESTAAAAVVSAIESELDGLKSHSSGR